MSPLTTNLGGPTPRRSGRLSSKAGSVLEQSVMTTITSGGTRQRRQGPLTKVKARRSNAYGASGRVGAAEELTISATGFAQAFQNQRGDAVARDDEDGDEEDDDSDDELGNESRVSSALNGTRARISPVHERSSPPRISAPFVFSETPEVPFSDDDLAFSIGNTSKSFGMEHEAGMLQDPQRRTFLRSSSQQPTPVPRSTLRLVGQSARVLPNTKSTPDKVAIDESIDDLLAEERARLQREGLGRSRPTPQTVPRPLPLPEPRPVQRTEVRNEPRIEPRVVPRAIPQTQSRIEQRLQTQAELRLRPQARPQAQPQLQTQPQLPSSPPEAVEQWLGQVEPAEDYSYSELPQDESEWPWLPLLRYVFWAMLAVGAVFSLSAMLSAIFSDPNRQVGMHTAIGSRVTTAWYDVADWIMPAERKYNETKVLLTWLNADGSMDDHLVWSRMWRNHQEYEGKFNAMDRALDNIKEELPDYVVLRRYPDGRREITDDFWNALLSKAQSKMDDTHWADFLKANSQKLQNLDSKPVDVGKPTTRPEMVHRREFIETMEQNYKTLSIDVDQKILEALKTHKTQITSLIHAEARKTLIDSIRLQSLAQSNLVANYELNLKRPNYFSTGLGARIEPGRTSSTFDNSPSWSAGLMRSIFHGTLANPPKAALTKWEEFGDCWCAAPNPMKGYARLSVSLARHVFPRQFTVEHAPMSMSPTGNINNAPRDIELWVETDQPIKQHYGQGHNKCLDPADLRGRGYVCLGAFRYNIHNSNHVQTFDLEAELSAPTNRVAVQVTSNWGAPNTCIYRVRLHGDDAQEKYNYDVTLND